MAPEELDPEPPGVRSSILNSAVLEICHDPSADGRLIVDGPVSSQPCTVNARALR